MARMPHVGRDPVIVAISLAAALQYDRQPQCRSARGGAVDHAGSMPARPITDPEEAALAGTVRTFSPEIAKLIRERMREICAGMAATFGVQVDIDIRGIFDVLVNHPEQAVATAAVAARSSGRAMS